MFYDLNERLPDANDTDLFTIDWKPYQIGPISDEIRKEILDIDPNGDILASWRPIIARLMRESNDDTPKLSKEILGALIPIVTKKLNENRQHV